MVFDISTLRGSIVRFRERKRPKLSDSELSLKRQGERAIRDGMHVLRKLKTCALDDAFTVNQQEILKEAHKLSILIADEILNQTYPQKPTQVRQEFLETVLSLDKTYEKQEADSAHGFAPLFAPGNLIRAADDIYARIKERVGSIYKPSRKLNQEDTDFVLNEFSRGTNDLSINAINLFYNNNTKIVSILTGGSVYTEMVRQVLDRYAEHSLKIRTSVAAIDKDKKKTAFETNNSCKDVKDVILVDDCINGGGTMLTALWSAGEHFPNANIRCGMGIDWAGGFQKRRDKEYMGYLELIFQDFADFTDSGDKNKARAIFTQAERYAKEHNVQLQAGWYKRKERYGL